MEPQVIKDIVFTLSAALGIPALVLSIGFAASPLQVEPINVQSVTTQRAFWTGAEFLPYLDTTFSAEVSR